MKNDVAFVLSDRLNLYEHQSTFSPNMPLRNLFYICREYEKLIDRKSLYSNTLMQIPSPHFVVFYNGIDQKEECQILKLSDLYAHNEQHPELELKIRMLNINQGYNQTIMKHCQILSEYAQYVEKVRTYADNMSIEDAVEYAVTESIKQGILTEFLTKYRQAAIQMSIFEYDEEKEIRLLRQAEREGARQENMEVALRNLMETMKLNLNQAMDALKIPAEERSIYTARIQKQ